MDKYPWVIPYAVVIVVSSLAIVVLAVVAVLLCGLYDTRVDNDRIFSVISPAFQGAVGGFLSLLGTLSGYIAGKRAGKAEMDDDQTNPPTIHPSAKAE